MKQNLLSALQNPALYDHPIDHFEVIETHISWVLLTGPFAYKIRKPVDFGFLNFTTLAQRLFDCEEELRLNQRLSPQLYTGLTPIYGTPDLPSLEQLNNSEPAFEYAVKMRQFSQGSLLSAMDQNQSLTSNHINELASLIAEFHQQIPPAASDSLYGSPETLWSVIEQNFIQIRPRLSNQKDLQQLQKLENWAKAQFKRLRPLIAERKTAGQIKECHSDLHLGNIAIYQQQICPFDCIEFNAKYRWVDTLNDLAFLLMDLEVRGRNELSRLLLDQYLQINGDYQGLPLLQFFKSYRALVRAKVTLLSDPELTEDTIKTYHRYADLAEHYSLSNTPSLTLMHGISGSGKSWLSTHLLEQLPLIRLRSDVIRKQQFQAAEDIYQAEITQQTYHYLRDLSQQLLAAGLSVIVDATFLKRDQRQPFIDLSLRQQVPLTILNCRVSDAMAKQRISQRNAENTDFSDATLEVMEQQLSSAEALSEVEQTYSIEMDSERPRLEKIIALLK
ncbi:MAG: AAA family ATPase [Motiliproteus sp.]